MTYDDLREAALKPGLVWGFDFEAGRSIAVTDADLVAGTPRRGFRWLHFNLADRRTTRWLEAHRPVCEAASALILGADDAQHAVADGRTLSLVLHDFQLDFFEVEPTIGTLRIAVGLDMIVTARPHPIRSAETIKRRLDAGHVVAGPVEALDLVFASLIEGFRAMNAQLDAQVEEIEDELLKDRPATNARALTTLRALMVRMHRMFAGSRALMRDLEEDEDVPPPLRDAIDRYGTRLSTLDHDLLAIQSQLRLLRDEMDLQATQKTNDNLYFLSILSALLLPATLVTGIFGMNTGGLLWLNHRQGSLLATSLALGSSATVYIVLRLMGFIRR
jgi:Mg2+ and Co2+ transporter CorA